MNRDDYVNATGMSAFTMWIDDITKLGALKRMRRMGVQCPERSMAALIRVLINEFAKDGDTSVIPAQENSQIERQIKDLIDKEYILTAGKNKRSNL